MKHPVLLLLLVVVVVVVVLCMQDYKFLCAAATICATLVNIQTQTDETENILTS